MWTCPKCHHQFYNKNQSHSCGAYTVDDFLKEKSEKGIALFHCFLYEYGKIGPFELHPVKTRVTLLTKMRFCAINKVGTNYIDIHLVLTQLFEDAECFYKIDNLANRFLCTTPDYMTKATLTTSCENIWLWLMRLGTGCMLNPKQSAKN